MPTPPPVGDNVTLWANDLRRWIGRTWDALTFKPASAQASEDGILLWDAAIGHPVVSAGGKWLRVSVLVDAPANATAPGVAGQMATDAGFIYVCTAANTWKRVAIASW